MMGFNPVTINGEKSATKPMDIVYLVASISFGIFICFFSIARKADFMTSKSEIADQGNFITFFMSIILSITSMVFSSSSDT